MAEAQSKSQTRFEGHGEEGGRSWKETFIQLGITAANAFLVGLVSAAAGHAYYSAVGRFGSSANGNANVFPLRKQA